MVIFMMLTDLIMASVKTEEVEKQELYLVETPQNPNEDPKRHEIEEYDYHFRPSLVSQQSSPKT